MVTKLYTHIIADANVLGGRPVIEGTDIPVSRLVERAAEGESLETIASESGVTVDAVRAALNFAARRADAPATPQETTLGDQVTGEAIAEEARHMGLDPTTLTPLVRRLLELRLLGAAHGQPPINNLDELAAEIASRRGGDYDTQQDSAQ